MLFPWAASALLAAGLLFGGSAQAGNQKEEQLADAVRLALANAIHDKRLPKPVLRDEAARARYQAWFGEMSRRLAKRIPDELSRTEFLETVWYESTRAGLDPGLVLGLIQVESAYRKYAISIAGARGYMQVMPFWTKVIGDSDRRMLFNMQTNLRYGCAILRMYIDMEKGNLYLALGRYNGSRGKPQYPNAVLAAWKKWEFGPSA
ncbi:lytic transglycosylase domain-containing protein [Massilia sp. IC2-476]|uniref:lytic transglycosylase domain-containing protein n=1 Tax=Massilia sp. IC2-476 TaxID=2887199 RepID=UPI001D10E279|nr:lytic transglycosylase domain-containing protein [Massilia sp. IC2-476]MCC2973155.1 lytic transglycosylase domain-containing protein [Massilia sp. IC2-476]